MRNHTVYARSNRYLALGDSLRSDTPTKKGKDGGGESGQVRWHGRCSRQQGLSGDLFAAELFQKAGILFEWLDALFLLLGDVETAVAHMPGARLNTQLCHVFAQRDARNADVVFDIFQLHIGWWLVVISVLHRHHSLVAIKGSCLP